VYLVLRGAGKIASFTTIGTPMAGVDNEDVMRFVVAACFFGAVGWGVLALVEAVLSRLGKWPASAARNGRLAVAGAALLGAVAAREHLPRFLINLPSETHAGGGVGPEIFNTIYFAVLSTAITLPIGVGAAVYLARFAKSKRFVGAVRTALDTLASLPS